MAPPDKTQALPSKENQLFKSIVKHYETKQYKKGLKAADTILKKFPTHGETLAMKGLTLNCLERKEEAYDFAKRGLKHDLRSHVCWHVLGLLYRSDRDYNEAVKCYRNALRNDKDNLQILRDLSLLQIHLRDIEGFMETRRQLMILRPQQRANWISFAMGAHLHHNYNQAIKILDEYIRTNETMEKLDYETSELFLYKNMVIEESGDIQKAMDDLSKIEKRVLDVMYTQEKRAEFLAKLGKFEDSEKQWRELIDINSENKNYHIGLQTALQLIPTDGKQTAEQIQKLISVYDDLASQYPKSDMIKRIPLNFVSGDLFKQKVSAYLKPKLRKGIPSLFMDLKSLYSDKDKVSIIETLLNSFIQCLNSKKKFEDADHDESPAALLWTDFFLAQHYDAIGDYQKALEIIDRAIQYTPTVIDLYLIKGKIFKHAGDLEQASDLYEKAREMDLADRYLNTKSAVYLLRADRVERACDIVGLFTKVKEGEDHISTLHDMQCMWFEQECGSSYARLGQYGRALKTLSTIDKHFTDIEEDQFDFHTYCLRKMTLRAYIDTLRFEDNLRGHKFFVRAVKSIIRIYLSLFDKPLVSEEEAEKALLAKMSQEEQKKFLKKKRIEARKAEKKKAEATTAKADADPEGKALVQIEDKLSAAAKFHRVLRLRAPKDLEVHILGCEIYLRKKKLLLVVQSINKAISIAPEDPHVHRMKVLFFQEAEKSLASMQPVMASIIKSKMDSLVEGQTLEAFNKAFLEKHSASFPHRAAAAEVIFLLTKDKAQALKTFNNLEGARGYQSMQDATATYQRICSLFDQDAAEEFRKQCRKNFPLSTFFMNAEEKEQYKKEHKQEVEASEDATKEESSQEEPSPSQ